MAHIEDIDVHVVASKYARAHTGTLLLLIDLFCSFICSIVYFISIHKKTYCLIVYFIIKI